MVDTSQPRIWYCWHCHRPLALITPGGHLWLDEDAVPLFYRAKSGKAFARCPECGRQTSLRLPPAQPAPVIAR